MKKSPGYYILLAITWPMQLLPLGFHYFIADILYVLVYHVVGYRKGVVARNLRKSFPEKSPDELKAIEKQFYRGFADIFIETLYCTHINVEKQQHRLEVVNFKPIQDLLDKGENVLVVAGHFGNWEFMQLFKERVDVNKYFVYKKINNKTFDQFYRRLRGKAATPLEMKKVFRRLISDIQNKENYIAYFISDQRPVKPEIKHWVNFMNQDTPVMLGTEKIALKTNAVIYYMEIVRLKRGYHRVNFELLFEDSSKTKQYEITDAFMRRLEQSIREHPAQYLWTHKRWKFNKADFS